MNDDLSKSAPDFDLTDRAFARASGSLPIAGNAVRLLLDARENFPAWLAAIRAAERSILFESYIFADDAIGHEFADALAEKARAGMRVRVIADWLGSIGSGPIWERLRAAGAEVRVFNPPHLASPLGWVTRNHRKTIVVDGRIGYVSGLCVSAKWVGKPERKLEPWRDTGVEIIGPAVRELAGAFAQVWAACPGGSLDSDLGALAPASPSAGNVRLRVIAGIPSATGVYRLDLTIAALAHEHLWLTDAYFVGTAPYVQSLAAAARDGVDVRLLVPGASDVPAISPISRAGYRALLESGVRVFEWRGTMMHAKTAVADGLWSRVGSTNLNLASWMGNYELDVAIEDRAFAARMAEQYEADLTRSTEIVLRRNRVRRTQAPRADVRRARSGSAGRAAAGALSVGSALGAALTDRRPLGPAEGGLLAKVAIVGLAVAVVAALWPAVVAWPLAVICVWFGLAWLAKAFGLKRMARERRKSAVTGEDGEPSAKI